MNARAPTASSTIIKHHEVGSGGDEDRHAGSTHYGFDRTGELIAVTDALGHVTQYSYDETGARLSITDARQRVTGFGYDFTTGVKIARGLPQGPSEIDVVDPAGLVTRHTDFMGCRTNVTRDPLRRRDDAARCSSPRRNRHLRSF